MSLLKSWNFIYNALLGIVKLVLRGHQKKKKKKKKKIKEELESD
jgi:hypothetical protein